MGAMRRLAPEVLLGRDGTYERMRFLLAARGYYEASTTNELARNGRVLEADKLWLSCA